MSYRLLRHYERRAAGLGRLAAAGEYSRHLDDRLAAELQSAEADQCDELARELRAELGVSGGPL